VLNIGDNTLHLLIEYEREGGGQFINNSSKNESRNGRESLSEMIKTHGIILGTERYDECLAFYRDTLELPVWFEKDGLCCLHFGNGYLMIETGGHAHEKRKTTVHNPTMIRFNVEDVDAAADLLEKRNVSLERKAFDWGTVATFSDPDGNPCELKNADDPFFQ